jgi:hypothetical protein
VRQFLDTFAGGRGGLDLEDECRLLEPVMAGGTVLYVVDCSHPFRPSYEIEMQILRWTGRPCFALINQTKDRAHLDEWKAALGQYFNAVRYFNAHKNQLEDRLSLLTMLCELDEEARGPLQKAITTLRTRQHERYDRAAAIIADALFDLVGFQLREPVADPGAPLPDAAKQRLEERFLDGLVRREATARQAVEATFAHRRLSRVESTLGRPLFDRDLLSEETWQLLGQSKLRLIAAGALGGALVGGAIDAATLGHSFLAGTLIGGGLGGLGSAAAIMKSPEARVLGIAISRTETVVGPHQSL